MAMTAKQQAQYIGRKGQLAVEDGKLIINVTCDDVRQVWGRVDVLVMSDGSGSAWVGESRVDWESK